MARYNIGLTDDVAAYVVDVAVKETEPQKKLRAATTKMSNAMMQIGPDQGAFMAWLVRLIGAKKAIEVGTFTGYSALAVAAALPDDGKLVCCDVSEEYTSVGEPFWEEAGVRDRIDLRIAPATETLKALIDEGGAGHWDFAFIDADKPSYDAYYESLLILLRRGGVIAIDNVLWSGSVANPEKTDPSTEALRAINEKVFSDERVDASMIPLGDGVTLARKR